MLIVPEQHSKANTFQGKNSNIDIRSKERDSVCGAFYRGLSNARCLLWKSLMSGRVGERNNGWYSERAFI